jgi:hypothetical protein
MVAEVFSFQCLFSVQFFSSLSVFASRAPARVALRAAFGRLSGQRPLTRIQQHFTPYPSVSLRVIRG